MDSINYIEGMINAYEKKDREYIKELIQGDNYSELSAIERIEYIKNAAKESM